MGRIDDYVGFPLLYNCAFTQTGVAAPVESFIKRIGIERAIYAYTAPGNYTITFPGAPLATGRTSVILGSSSFVSPGGFFFANRSSTSVITLVSRDLTMVDADGLFKGASLLVLVWP